MEAGFTKGFQLAYAGHDQGKERGEKFLEKIADKVIFLLGPTDNGGRINSVFTMIEMAGPENRIIVLQGVVPVMITKRALRSAYFGRHYSLDGKFGLGNKPVPTPWIIGHGQLFSLQQRGEHELGNIFRQRRNGGEHQGRRSADIQGHGQGLVVALGNVIMETAALVDLPVDAGGGIVIALDAIHAQVVTEPLRVFGIDKGQGDKGAAVRMPGGEHGQLTKSGRLLQAFHDRRS